LETNKQSLHQTQGDSTIDIAVNQPAHAPKVSAAAVNAATSERPTLGTDQAELVQTVAQSGRTIDVVIGKAGAGKTFALDALRSAFENEDKKVIGAAVAARAARELQTGTGIRSTTAHSLISGLERGRINLTPNTVLVVDEAGMLPTRQLARLVHEANQAGAKTLLVGDPKQLPEIDAGGLFSALAKRLPTVHLTENRRQTDPIERQALGDLRHGNIDAALAGLERTGNVTIAPNADTVRAALVADWHTSPKRTESVMVASHRSDAVDLNNRARQLLTHDGTLGPVVLDDGRNDYRIGDVVLTHANRYDLGLINGTTGHVVGANEHGLLIDTDERRALVPTEYIDEGHLTHGYALTIHKAQGMTADECFILGDDSIYAEMGYTGLTRGRHANRLYVVASRDDTDQPTIDPLADIRRGLGVSRAQTAAIDIIQTPGGTPMTTPNQTNDPATDITIAVVAVGSYITVAQWLTAAIATSAAHQTRTPANLGDAFGATIELKDQLHNPANAWPTPIAELLPGPWLYWPVAAIVHLLLALIAFKIVQVIRNSPDAIDRRKRLGVNAQSRTARRSDLTPVAINGAAPGRYHLGRAHGRNLATEPPPGTTRKRTTPGAVAVIAPSRSGKTFATVNSINQWQGPSILSSVKRDLIDGTLAQRAALGEVRIFDPKAISGQPRANWTPLHRSQTRTGSTQMARMLLSATGHDRTSNGSFWTDQAEGLLAGLLWLAANTDHTITDVTNWVTGFDHPTDDNPGTVAGLFRALIKSDSPLASEAKQVHRQLQGIWNMDSRMASSYYVSARIAVSPWTDPAVADTALTHDIDLDWLTSGDNTLYIVAPVVDQTAVAPALGALIADLVAQAIDLVDRQQQHLDRPLLLVLGEAANTPITQLPQWASLLTGYNVQLVTIWQAKSQIDTLYGVGAEALLTNHRSKIFYGGMTDIATINYLTTLLGHEHQPGVLNHHRADHTSPTPTMVQLTPANVLRGIKTGQALLVHGSLPPIHLKTT